ncbi:unnamed protein product, partial [Mycena citricolor]
DETSAMNQPTSLAAASEARKARLVALKRRKDGAPDEPVVKNRNFDPETRTLKKRVPLTDDVDMEDTVERNVTGLAEKIIAEDEERRAQELDIFNIAPKRPNWDLKRETDKKLAKLQRRTQEAIHTLIRWYNFVLFCDTTDTISLTSRPATCSTEG